jgi:hypothetical protein
VLEIGVGSGLLLAKLAPYCESYWGTDFSAQAIRSLSDAVAADHRLADKVTLLDRAADDFTGIPTGFFDVMVINSVIQYFPGASYCLDVFRKSSAALDADGTLFVGDVRNLRLLECFHAGVAAQRSGVVPGSPAHRAALAHSLKLERELLVDPAFFVRYALSGPDFGTAKVWLKRGAGQNELTRYRYDVVLTKNSETPADVPAVVWNPHQPGIDGVLTQVAAGMAWVTGIPNARLVQDLAALAATTGSHLADTPGLDPEVLTRAGEAAGYRVRTQWSDDGEGRTFDAYFERGLLAEPDTGPSTPAPVAAIGDLPGYFNDPVAGPHL